MGEPTIGGSTMRALSEVCPSEICAAVAIGLWVLGLPLGYQPKGRGPLGENLATSESVIISPALALTKRGAAISSVPASTLGSCSTPPLLGFALFCARPT